MNQCCLNGHCYEAVRGSAYDQCIHCPQVRWIGHRPTLEKNLLDTLGGHMTTQTILPPSQPAPRLCEYCGDAPATGYVKTYKAWVCEPCYEDQHGEIL